MWPDDDDYSADDKDRDLQSFYADMDDMPNDQPSVEELADMSQRYDVETPF